MGVKFFGQYLLEKNIIKSHELAQAVEYQEQRNKDFGECAFSKGYITHKDLEKIKSKQKSLDMRFGEIAILLDILTPAQVSEILDMQKSEHTYIGDSLVKHGFISQEDVEKELALFKKDQSAYSIEEILTPTGVDNPDVVKEIVGLTQKIFYRIARSRVKVDAGQIIQHDPKKNFVLVSLTLTGNQTYEYCLSLSENLSRTITYAIIGETVKDSSKELIIDGVKEFCNIVCGNIISKLSHSGKVLHINTPKEIAFTNGSYNLIKGRKALSYSLVSTEEKCLLILIEEH